MSSRITWNQVNSANFSGVNEAHQMAANLMGRATNGLSDAIGDFQDARTQRDSAALQADALKYQDPAALQAALADGSLMAGRDPRYLNAQALDFASQQRGRLLGERQTEASTAGTQASTALTNLNITRGQFQHGRDQLTAGRDDVVWEAKQSARPILNEAQRRAANGDIPGAQDWLNQHSDILAAGQYDMQLLLSGISGTANQAIQDTQAIVKFNDEARIYGVNQDANGFAEAAVQTYSTMDDATRAIQENVREGRITAEMGRATVARLIELDPFPARSEGDSALNALGVTPFDASGNGGQPQNYFEQALRENLGDRPPSATAAQGGRAVNGEAAGAFQGALQAGGLTNPHAIAAVMATGQHESGFDPRNGTGTWPDASESGQEGTSGGYLSWRNERYQNMVAFTGGDLSPEKQAAFFLQENPELTRRLQAAGSVEEAAALMANAWMFAGYNRPGGEAGARLATAQSYAGGSGQVSAAPGMAAYRGSSAPAYSAPRSTGGSAPMVPPTAADQGAAPSSGAPYREGMDPRSAELAQQALDAATQGAPQVGPTVEAARAAGLEAAPVPGQANPVQGMLDRALMDRAAAPAMSPQEQSMMDRNLEAATREASLGTVEGLVAAGSQGENPLFTPTEDGKVTARPPQNQEEQQLIARAAREGLLGITPESEARQARIDEATRMMLQAERAPKSFSVRGPVGPDATQSQIDSNTNGQAADIRNNTRMIAAGIVNGDYGANSDGLRGFFERQYDYYMEPAERAAQNETDRGTAQAAEDWWRSDEAQKFFTENPQAMEQASQSPILFAQERMAEQASRAMGGTGQEVNQPSQGTGSTAGNGANTSPQTFRDAVGPNGRIDPIRQIEAPPGPVTPREVTALFRSVSSAMSLDTMSDQYSDIDRAIIEGRVAGGNVADVATSLTGENGAFGSVTVEDMQVAVHRIAQTLDVSYEMAGALIKHVGVRDESWFPNWLSNPTWRVQGIEQVRGVYEQYMQSGSDANGDPQNRMAPGLNRLNAVYQRADAATQMANLQAGYEAAKLQYDTFMARPNLPQEERDRMERWYQEQALPALAQGIIGIHNSGVTDMHTRSRAN